VEKLAALAYQALPDRGVGRPRLRLPIVGREKEVRQKTTVLWRPSHVFTIGLLTYFTLLYDPSTVMSGAFRHQRNTRLLTRSIG